MSKRMFQVLDEMNQDDIKNGTKLISISNYFISADRVKQGCKVSIGCDESVLLDIANNTHLPVLMMVNKDEYFKRKNQ